MNQDESTRIAAYYDNFLGHLRLDHERDNQRLARVKVKLGSLVTRDMSILDLGCGTGLTSKFMAMLGAKVTAVDISPKLIEFARVHSAHKNIKYFCSDITEPQPDGRNSDMKFDGIVMVDVFEHVIPEKLRDLLSNVERHSHELTWVFLNFPDARYQEQAHIYIKDRLQIIDEGYAISWLLDEFGEYGFEAVDIDIYGVDTDCQYNSILFRRKGRLVEKYKRLMCPEEQLAAQSGAHYRGEM